MFKKISSFTLIILILLVLTGCFRNETLPTYNEDRYVETNFVNKSEEYQVEDSIIELLYLKQSNLALANVVDFLKMLDGLYLYNDFEFVYNSDTLTINITQTYNSVDYSERLVIDSTLDTVNVTSLDFFDLYLENPDTDYSENLVSLEPIVNVGNHVIFELGKYDFDIVNIGDNFYLPLAILNLLFNQNNYFDAYFNGEVIYGIDTSDIAQKDLKTILKSPLNNYHMPEDLKLHNYQFATFIIDYFYGLKSDRKIDSASSFIRKNQFISGDVEKNIFNLTKELDDLHTSHMTRGYYSNKDLALSFTSKSDGPIITKFYDDLAKVQKEAIRYFGVKNNYINFKDYEYIDNDETLIIYLLEFTVDTPVEIEAIIKNAKPTTKNIIIDLTFNTGGNLGAVLRMFALMTDDEIKYHFLNPLNNETITFRTKGERKAYDNYSYYLKTSSVTYSAANLAANIAKELDIKVIGRKSSGGASAISFFVFPTGSIIVMSSNSILTNQIYQSIEKGIEVDYHLNNLYNKEQILAAIK